jgi:hypothetical protein
LTAKSAKRDASRSITYACSLTTMHAHESSVNLGSNAKPSCPKNALEASRSLTGRLTKRRRDCVAMMGSILDGCLTVETTRAPETHRS